ncbi:MAG: HAMP domain-containing histidine kinase [Gammaproteobacteria bacterium]|nr:HAMP domain-containing histidine kinase [Gammaproteobacteria bacterium]
MTTNLELISGNSTNLKRLIWLRLIVAAGECLVVWYAIVQLHIALPVIPVAVVMGIVLLVSGLTLVRLRLSIPVSDNELFAQFTLEVLALTALLYFTGGSTNPFSPLYLLPLTLTAATLPGAYTWGMLIMTVGCYSALLFIYIPLPEVHGSHDDGFRLHVLGMWISYLLSATLIAAFAARMTGTMKRQNRKIAAMREQQLQQERVLALGTLAAGAAHELGTPLSTMAVVLNDIPPDTKIPESKLATLKDQIDRCKTILGSISATAGKVRAESGSVMTLDIYLNNIIQRWKEMRPTVKLTAKFSGTEPAPSIIVDQTLDQALINLLNNAADVSPDDIEVNGNWDNETLVLEVADRGEGLSPEIASQAGGTILSTKQDGLGLGLFLTYSTLERLGGQVRILGRKAGGTIFRLHLPLSALRLPNQNG